MAAGKSSEVGWPDQVIIAIDIDWCVEIDSGRIVRLTELDKQLLRRLREAAGPFSHWQANWSAAKIHTGDKQL